LVPYVYCRVCMYLYWYLMSIAECACIYIGTLCLLQSVHVSIRDLYVSAERIHLSV